MVRAPGPPPLPGQPPPLSSNEARGREAQAAGGAWEDTVTRHHLRALERGLVAARVEHNEPHWRKIRGQWQRVEPSVADFTGILANGWATTLGAECKSTKGGRLPKSAVSPLQEKYLAAVAAAQGMALLLAEFRGGKNRKPRGYAAPWLEVPWVMLESAWSVSEEDLLPWRIEGDCYLARFCVGKFAPEKPVIQVSTPRRIFARE